MFKKYFWLKLKDNFFQQKEIKKLRKIAGGDTFTIIYLKMQLLSLKNGGILKYEGTEETLAEQLSYEIDEDIDNIQVTITFLISNNLIEEIDGETYLLTKASECIGKEGESAERVRKHRERKNLGGQTALQSNIDVTSECYQVQKSNTEIEIRDRDRDKREEIEISIINNTSSTKVQPIIEKWNSLNLQKIVSINPGTNRYKLLNARLKEFGLEVIIEGIENIKNSSFLKGQNKKNWIITFDWFIKPNNFQKVLENNYKDKEVKTNGTRGSIRKSDSSSEVKYDYSRFEQGEDDWQNKELECDF